MAGTGPKGPHSRGRHISGINVTPLVDIMLVLLVIFMVTAQFASPTAIPLDLPKANESEEQQTVLSIELPEDGSVHVNGEAAEAEQLEGLARKELDEDPELRAVIQADGDVSHRRVMRVMDELRAGGLTRVAFGTQPDGDEADKEAAEGGEGDDSD